MDKDIGEVLESLLDYRSMQNLELQFTLESLSNKLSRRQAVILRLLLLQDRITQVQISKLLGCSAPTINLDIRKIKEEMVKIMKQEGKDYSRYLIKKVKNKIKDLKSKVVFNIEGDKDGS